MKKKQRCLLKRFAALVAALVISFSLPVSAFAASDTEVAMPSQDDFRAHYGSWFVWRTRDVMGSPYYELCSSPVVFDSSGNLDTSLTPSYSFISPSYFDVSVSSGSDSFYYYACALPVPLFGCSGLWSELPSFPVGSTRIPGLSCCVSLYSSSSWLSTTDYYIFLSPTYSSFSSSISSSFSDESFSSSSSFDSVSSTFFPSSFYSFPFAYRSGSSSIRTSYSVQGGDNDCINFTSSGGTGDTWVSFKTNKFFLKSGTFVSCPDSYSCPSTDLGLVVIKKVTPPAGGTINSASSFSPSAPFSLNPTLLVPVGFLPDVKLGDWISDSPEDLQDVITNEFNVDSDKLKDSKDSLNSWNSTSSVDTDLANTSLSTINALFQNLGQFLAIVSLMIFGAVVLRMLLRKAVDG